MKKRTAFIGAILSLIPLGHPLLIKTGVVLSSTGLMIAVPEKVNAKSSDFYFNRGLDKAKKGDHYGAISDYTKAIEIDPKNKGAYKNRGIAKEEIGDMKGACSDWRQTVFLSPNDVAAKWVRDTC